jgi:4-hydroxy-4-methyl-2-oxoglutarate aldolase
MLGPAAAADFLRDLPAATIYEAAGKIGALNRFIQRLASFGNLSGFAFTVRCTAYETLPVFHAIDTAAAGDILVIDAGESGATVWGGSSTIAAQKRGLAGIVTNGAVRDIDEVVASGFQVFSAGPTLRGTHKNDKGEIAIPIMLAGQLIRPGDFVRGDSDGVVIVEAHRLAETAAAALRQRDKELRQDDALRSGARISDLFDPQRAK